MNYSEHELQIKYISEKQTVAMDSYCRDNSGFLV
jgi:hypothetical protein